VSALINYGPGNPPSGAVDPHDTYRCVVCNGLMWDERAEAHELDLQVCADADCLESRIRILKGFERMGRQISQSVKPRQFAATPREIHADLLAVALALEHYVALER
jgi:hypothetical protein